MDRGAWWAAVHAVARSQTRLSDFTFTFMHWRRKWQPTSVFLPGESQGRGSLVGYCLWGRTESDTTEATQQQPQPGGLACCSPWGHKESDTTEQLNWTEVNISFTNFSFPNAFEPTVRVFHALTKFSKDHRTIVMFPIDYGDHFAEFQVTRLCLSSCTIV